MSLQLPRHTSIDLDGVRASDMLSENARDTIQALSELSAAVDALALEIAEVDAGTAVPSAHAALHIDGGADPINGDRLEVSYVPSGYNRNTTGTDATANTQLAAHLNGISGGIATAAGAAALAQASADDAQDAVDALLADFEAQEIQGDVFALNTGAVFNATVSGLQGNPVLDILPGDATALAWDDGANNWAPSYADYLYTDFVPANYTRSTTGTGAPNVFRVAPHFRGISDAIGTINTSLSGKLATGASAGGDLDGTYPNPGVNKVKGVAVSGTAADARVLMATSSSAAEWTWVVKDKVLLQWEGTDSLAALTNGGTVDHAFNGSAWTTNPVITKTAEAENVGGYKWLLTMRSTAATQSVGTFWLACTVPLKYRIEVAYRAVAICQPGVAFLGASASNYYYTSWQNTGDRSDNGTFTANPTANAGFAAAAATSNTTLVLNLNADKRASKAPKFNGMTVCYNNAANGTLRTLAPPNWFNEPASDANWGSLTFNRVGLSFRAGSTSNATAEIYRVRVVDETT